MRSPRKSRKNNHKAVARAAQFCDDVDEFDKFRRQILPAIRLDLENGLSGADILQKYKAIAAARQVMVMVSKSDALASKAAKDVLDRADGKPVETQVRRHKYEDLSDEQLAALYKTKVQDLKNAAADTHSEDTQLATPDQPGLDDFDNKDKQGDD